MTQRISNNAYISILESEPLENVGWYARVLSERDYTTTIAEVRRFAGLGFTVEANAEGGGKVTLDADDSIFTAPLPLSESTPLIEQEALWQIIENGTVRAEFLAEDVLEDVILTKDGPRSTQIAGRGTGSVLEWARVLPSGMPNPTSTDRSFTGAPMAIWLTLFNESKADGYLTWVKPLFSAAQDSFGEPWSTSQSITVQAGEDLLALLTRWCEQNEYSWRMLPGFRLQVMKAAGHHREETVLFTQYRAQNEHKRTISRRKIANTVYADGGDLGIAVAQSVTSQEKWRKRAAWVQAGDADDATARSAVANITLALSKDAKASRTVKVPADRIGRVPFVNYDVHDWITIELPDGSPESGAMKVDGIAIDIDRDGQPTVELTLMSRFEARAIRLQRALDKLGGSTTGGSGSTQSTPIPVTKIMGSQKLLELADVDGLGIQAGDVIKWDGAKFVDVTPTMDFLADVDPSVPTNGDVLTFAAGTGLWIPAAPSGGGISPTARLEFSAPVTNATASTNTSQSKAVLVTAIENAKITLLGTRLNTVAGRTYRFRVYEFAHATAYGTQVGSSYDVASPGNASDQTITVVTDIDINRGKLYLLAVTDLSGSAIAVFTTTTQMWSASQHIQMQWPAKGAAFIAETNPTTTQAWTSAAASYGMIAETIAR